MIRPGSIVFVPGSGSPGFSLIVPDGSRRRLAKPGRPWVVLGPAQACGDGQVLWVCSPLVDLDVPDFRDQSTPALQSRACFPFRKGEIGVLPRGVPPLPFPTKPCALHLELAAVAPESDIEKISDQPPYRAPNLRRILHVLLRLHGELWGNRLLRPA